VEELGTNTLGSGMGYASDLIEINRKPNVSPGEEGGMNRITVWGILLLACVLAVVYPRGTIAKEGINYGLPQGVYIDLTREFYEALKAEGSAGNKTYTNNMSQEYLRQIAVSARFMVESNLRILQNQEKIIELLESVLKGRATSAK